VRPSPFPKHSPITSGRSSISFVTTISREEEHYLCSTTDIVAQTRQIFEKIKAILDEAGGSVDDIVKTVDYIVTTEGYKGTADVRREYFRHGFPATTGIVVKELLRPDALIEIEAIAVLEDKH
jgi:enamine deaminase RidA (YjgF/YER057c/UK114 family)